MSSRKVRNEKVLSDCGKELIRRQEFKGVEDAQQAIKQSVETYNYKRTHQGLGSLREILDDK